MLTLAIDTSCDETSAAVVCGLEVWSNIISSQVELHKPYGGVFPTVAKQAHKENIKPTVELALKRAGVSMHDVDEIAVTVGPGLAPALEVGIDYAKKLSRQYHKPIRPANHMEGHVLSVLAFSQRQQKRQLLNTRRQQALKRSRAKLSEVRLPALAVLVSGGHTEFVLIQNSKLKIKNLKFPLDRAPRLSIEQFSSKAFQYTKLGQTLDDAAGEALDKIGRMLGLGYPAGPVIEEFAKRSNATRYPMPLPMTTSKDYNLSFSGMKTHTRNLIESILKEKDRTTKDHQQSNNNVLSRASQAGLGKQEIYDLSASVQHGVFRHILYKLNKILQDYPEVQEVWLGGGVAANMTLRRMTRDLLKKHPKKMLNPKSEILNSKLETSSPVGRQNFNLKFKIYNSKSKITLRTPYSKRLCGDNAAMVGVNKLHITC